MSSRSSRRRHHKRLAALTALAPPRRDTRSARQLLDWRREAERRARTWDAPLVWDLARDSRRRAVAATLDPSGELQADLDRVCAEAVAAEAGRFLVRGSRPLADRARLCRPQPSS